MLKLCSIAVLSIAIFSTSSAADADTLPSGNGKVSPASSCGVFSSIIQKSNRMNIFYARLIEDTSGLEVAEFQVRKIDENGDLITSDSWYFSAECPISISILENRELLELKISPNDCKYIYNPLGNDISFAENDIFEGIVVSDSASRLGPTGFLDRMFIIACFPLGWKY